MCINCGHHVKELYREYSPTVLKLSSCNACNMVVDKYIEYDPIIIIIDLVLLNREAYRHVLFNTDYTFHWKLLVILEFMEAYWELSFNTKLRSALNAKTILLDKFYTGDLEYYRTLFQVVCSNAFFFLAIYCFTLFMELRSTSCNKQQSFNAHFFKRLFNQVMKFITLSSFGIFLFLPSLIWEKFGTEEYHFLFVIIYTALSQLVAYTVFCKCSKTWSIFVILCAYGIKIKASSLCKLIFGLYNL